MIARRVLGLVLLLVSCGGRGAPPTAPLPPEPPPVTPDAAPAEPPPPPPEVPGPMAFALPMPTLTATLVSAGKGKPKLRPLRYAPTVGARQALRLTLDLSYADAGGEFISPTVQLDLDAEVTAVDPAAGASVRATVVAADLIDPAEQLAEVDRAELARAVGARLAWTVDPVGQWSAVAIELDAGTSVTKAFFESARLALGASLVLPAAPVRVGATWDVTHAEVIAGVAMAFSTRYTLTAAGPTPAATGVVTVTAGTAPAGAPPSPASQVGGTGTASFQVGTDAVVPLGSLDYAAAMTLVVLSADGMRGEPATLRLRRAAATR